MFAKSDIGFLFHHYSGIWEPIFYVDTRGGKDVSLYYLLFSNGVHTRWPKIVKERVQEFSSKCSTATGGRGIFTSQTGISSTKMIGITSLKTQLTKEDDIQLHGMIRDTYNHVAGLVYTRTGGAPMYVAVPVVEDGIADITSRLILDWDDFDPAPMDEVLSFYEEYIVPRYPAYKIERLVKSQGTGSIVALQLANGLYVPVGSASNADFAKLPDPTPAEVAEMEWTLNRKIVMGATGAVPGESTQLKMKEFNEVYEHLRLTFSNWLAAVENGGEIRKVMESIIFRRDIPLFEKRRRMEIILAPQVESWIGESDEDKPRQASLLRVDCRLRPESECEGMCSWSQEKGKCLIHSPAKDPRHSTASAIHVLLLRLIEELLRFGQKRQQIFDQQVSQLASLDNPIRVGDQYIIPEKSMVWTDLLRLEWAAEITEKPIYLEEMTQGAPAAAAPAPPLNEVSALNATLQTVMGADDPATGLLRLYPSPARGFLPFLQLLNIESEVPDIEGEELSETTLSTLLRKSGMPIVQIDLRVDPPAILAKKPPRDKGLGFPVFVLRKGLPPSLLCRDPENPALLHRGELPKGLQTLIEGAKTIFIPRATA
jgi:hypothetical protein